MRKISTTISERFSYKKLYLDDLKDIHSIIKELSEDELEIRFNDYYLENIDELKNVNDEKVKCFEIKSSKPQFSFSYNYGSPINLTAYDNSNLILGALARIKDIIRNRLSIKFVLSGMYFNIALAIISYISLTITTKIKNVNAIIPNIFGYICLYSFFMMFLSFRNAPGYNKIILRCKNDSPNFIKRNWDNILLSIISLVLGWLIGKYY